MVENKLGYCLGLFFSLTCKYLVLTFTPAIIQCTTDTRTAAEAIANALLEKHLAACVQLMPIQSHFVWDGKTEKASEYLLLIKTQAELYAEVEATILQLHSYDTPEILLCPVAQGLPAYLFWMKEQTTDEMQ